MRRRSPLEKTLNPALCQDLVAEHLFQRHVDGGDRRRVGVVDRFQCPGHQGGDGRGVGDRDVVDGDVGADPHRRDPVVVAAGEHDAEFVVGNVAGADGLTVQALFAAFFGRGLMLFDGLFADAVAQFAVGEQGDDFDVGHGQHPHARGDVLVDGQLVVDDDALFPHHRHTGMLFEPVGGFGGRHERPAAQFRRDVADVQQRLQQPEPSTLTVISVRLLCWSIAPPGSFGRDTTTRQHAGGVLPRPVSG